MKIEYIRIENFRCFKDQTVLFDNYTSFVGPNGAGKSTVFNALNVFFRQYKDSKTDLSKLTASDFHHKDVSKEIRITVTFTDLSKEAEKDLAAYARQGKLIVTASAKYDPVSEKAEVKQFGNRLGFKDFKAFFEAEKNGEKVSDLKIFYTKLQSQYKNLEAASSKTDMIAKLQEYEAARPLECDLIPSEDQFYGVSKGVNKLAPYIQWIFISASKDVTEEGDESKASALGQLLSRTVRSKINFEEKVTKLRTEARKEYQKLLDKEQSVLNDISKSLQNRLASWAHPNIEAQVSWKQDPDKSVKIEEPWAFIKLKERGFEGDLARFGHGLQRSYMLALLQELALIDDKLAPTLIMGIEEPELYQHPPQARYLAETLLDLSEKGTQVLICTHSPLFIPGDHFDKVRIVRETGNPSHTVAKGISYEDLAKELKLIGAENNLQKETGMIAKLYPSLNPVINEMFFCKVLILVEGIEDVGYITSYLSLTDKMTDFRKWGCHIIPAGGKSMLIKPLSIAKLLGIPTYVVFDGDTDKKKEGEVKKHKQDNKALLSLQGHGKENEWPTDHIQKNNLTCWKTSLTELIEEEFGPDWGTYKNKAEAFYGNAGDLQKNPLSIAKTLELAWADKKKSKVLSDLVDSIISFAKNSLKI